MKISLSILFFISTGKMAATGTDKDYESELGFDGVEDMIVFSSLGMSTGEILLSFLLDSR